MSHQSTNQIQKSPPTAPKKRASIYSFFSYAKSDTSDQSRIGEIQVKKKKKGKKILNQSQYDWWSRFYESKRDMTEPDRNEEENVPRLTV